MWPEQSSELRVSHDFPSVNSSFSPNRSTFADSVMWFTTMKGLIGFMFLMHCIDSYLEFRQEFALKLLPFPNFLEGVISQEKFDKSIAYNADRSRYYKLYRPALLLRDTTILCCYVLPWLWKTSGDVLESLGISSENETYQTLVFIAAFLSCARIMGVPFVLYFTLVIKERHGYNKQTICSCIRNMINVNAFDIVRRQLVLAAIVIMVQKVGPLIALYYWGFRCMSSLIMMRIHLLLIAPLFKKFTSLPEGELRSRIVNLASSLDFPLKELYVVDAVTEFSHSNALTYGLFKNNHIAVYDSLIQRCKTEEVVAVVAHELGHWKMNHAMYTFIVEQVLELFKFGAYTSIWKSKDLYLAVGFDTQPVVIGIILFKYFMEPIKRLVRFGLNFVTRAHEFEADAFARKLGYSEALRGGLVKLQGEKWALMNMDPWYSAYRHARPSAVERLAAMYEADKKAD